MPRDADRTVRANGQQVKRRIEAAAVDEFADKRGKAFLIVAADSLIIAERGALRSSAVRGGGGNEPDRYPASDRMRELKVNCLERCEQNCRLAFVIEERVIL